MRGGAGFGHFHGLHANVVVGQRVLLTLLDTQGTIAQRYDLQPGTCYLLRPDLHVAARWRSFDAARVRAAVARATGNAAASA